MKIAICSSGTDAQRMKQWLRQDELDCLFFFLFQKGEQLLASYRQQHYYDLIFLNGEVGLEMLQKLCRKDRQTQIVWLAKQEQDLLPALAAGAVAGLLYPLQEGAVRDIFRRSREIFLQQNQELRIPVYHLDGLKEEKVIHTREILYLESRLRKIYIHTIYQQQYTCYGQISQLEQQLADELFLRVHKSCLVNLRYICYIGVDQVGLCCPGATRFLAVPLARRRREQIKEAVRLI
ncbi:MAG: LytR/AlgR family response regulator transcription factor [Peptococcaceae bacterium]